MTKQLTVTIPAYNAEKYIEKCLDSFVGEGVFKGLCDRADERLELLVIDDGSTDRTGEIAESYAKRYPQIIRVIRKENGGHGSGINTGILHASGKYFKVVDADDWVQTENLKNFLDFTETAEADVLVAAYKTFNESNGSERYYQTYGGEGQPFNASEPVAFDDFAENFEKTPAAFQFHGLFFRTEFYRSLDIRLSEGVYYEDQEYAILPFLKAETILPYPDCFYVYRLGRGDQSISYARMEKSMQDMQTVLKKLLALTAGETEKSRVLFFQKRLAIAVTSYYSLALVKAEDKKSGRKAAEAFKQFLDQTDPKLSQRVDGKYRTLQKAGKIPGLAAVYASFFDSPLYLKFKKRWNR